MTAVEAQDHKVVLYKSANLKDWTALSEFGPANATGGQWECPDLFPLAVDGDPKNVKWVMVVNINPGGVAGGSAGQYFVGNFDGTTFTSETTKPVATPPPGRSWPDSTTELTTAGPSTTSQKLEERPIRQHSGKRSPSRPEPRDRL